MLDNDPKLDLDSLKVGNFLSYCEKDIYLIIKINKQDEFVVFDFLYTISNQVIRDYKIWRSSEFSKRAFRKWPHDD